MYIAWRNLKTGQMGKGPRTMPDYVAQALARELDRNFRGMEHQAVPVGEEPVWAELDALVVKKKLFGEG